MLGSCRSDAGSCNSGTGVSGGSGSGEDSGTTTGGACAVTGSQCDMCQAQQCCSLLTMCQADTNCNNINVCVETCINAANCLSTCEAPPNAAGVSLYNELTDCVTAKCAVCTQAGTGDSCAGDVTCNAGLTCNGGWCTKACAATSDCAGLGANSGNSAGFENACIPGTGGSTCYAGCQSNLDCQFIPGTYCATKETVEASNLPVCFPIPEAGTD